MDKGLIDIIIVNWNSGQLLKDCIDSILQSHYFYYRIHIVDNHSSDNSLDLIAHDDRIIIYKMESNIGFGKACNVAAANCNGSFILLLNPDTIIFPDTLSKAFNYVENDEQCIVYGCAQQDENGELQKFTVGRFPGLVTFCNEVLGLSYLSPELFKNGFIRSDWAYNKSCYVDHVMGSFYLIRSEWVKKNGLMDERFFVYLEDIDLSKRVVESGGKLFYDSDNVIIHKQGGTSEKVKAKRLFYSLHAKHLYIKKYFSLFAFVIADFVLLFPGLVARLIFAIAIQRSFKAFKESLMGYFLLYRFFFLKKPLQ